MTFAPDPIDLRQEKPCEGCPVLAALKELARAERSFQEATPCSQDEALAEAGLDNAWAAARALIGEQA